MGRVLRVVVVLAVFSLQLFAQNQRPFVHAPHKPIPPRVAKGHEPKLPPAKHSSLVGGLWMTDADLKSSIYLKSSLSTSSIKVTPILHLSNGVAYTLPDVTLEPTGIAIVDINAGLAAQGIASYATLSGYLELQYLWPWDPICATIRVVDTAHSLIFTYGLRPTSPLPTIKNHFTPPLPTSTWEGMWWKQESNVTGFVALANTSSEPATTGVQVTDQGSVVSEHNVVVSPHGLKLIRLPELQTVTSKQGGIRVVSSQNSDKLIINGGLEDPTTGYSAVLLFAPEVSSSTKSEQSGFAELGLMSGTADSMMSFPAGTRFTPYSILRNVTNAPVSISPTIWWMSGGVSQSAQLPQVNLKPYETQSMDLVSLLSVFGPENFSGSFDLTFDGLVAPGTLLLAAGSVDQTNTYVFEVTPQRIQESISKSISYWSTGNGDDTMVTVWNPADEAQDYIFKLFFTGGHYLLPIHLEPRATRIFNVSQIIQSQVPDVEGNIIPAAIHEGSAKITGTQSDIQHILVAADVGTYNVRKATCGTVCFTCNGYSSASLTPDPFSVAVGNDVQMDFSVTLNDEYPYDLTNDFDTQYSSTENIFVSSFAFGDPGLATGLGTGSAYIVADNPDIPGYWDGCMPGPAPNCPFYSGAEAEATGQVTAGSSDDPDHLVVLTDAQQTINCAPNPSTLERQVTYEVDDVNMERIQAPFALRENVPSNLVSSCNNQIVHTGASCTSNVAYQPGQAGKFTDVLANGCPASGVATPCGFQFSNQQWQWCSPSGNTSIGTIGPVNVENTVINMDGNILGFVPGTTFPK